MKHKKNETSFMKKIFKLLYYFIITVLCLFVLLIIFYLISSKLNTKEDYKPKISMFTIVSPSMTPVINVYDVVINVRPNNPDDIQIGDIITYISKDPNSEGMTITHRVTEISTTADGTIEYRTQGDNNDVPDNLYVTFDSVIGKEILIIPYLGKVQFLLANQKGWLILLLIPIVIFLLKDVFKLVELFGLRKKVDIISGVVTSPLKERKKIDEASRKEQIKKDLAIKEIQKLGMIRSPKEASGFLDKYNETIITVKENKYKNPKTPKNNKISIALSPKPKKDILDLDTIKKNNTKVKENKELNNKIQEYNVKIEELNRMLKEIDIINNKKTQQQEIEELLQEDFLKNNNIRVVNVESTKKGLKKNIQEELPNLKEEKIEVLEEMTNTIRLHLNPKEIKKINRKNKTGTLKPINNKKEGKVIPKKKSSLISIVKK